MGGGGRVRGLLLRSLEDAHHPAPPHTHGSVVEEGSCGGDQLGSPEVQLCSSGGQVGSPEEGQVGSPDEGQVKSPPPPPTTTTTAVGFLEHTELIFLRGLMDSPTMLALTKVS
ncbi:hypothetical protein Pmani_018613 [Petrolisthes manimaculis]|uniref:Uncharacterized protein n=1 Tax=Petrolisthes manimaculis TaxID=1843537 RepID=A0AAE1PJZ7_9EUCA|nr:hypothetical protein Pmani_018613 [Petrolisthes manimaculis]